MAQPVPPDAASSSYVNTYTQNPQVIPTISLSHPGDKEIVEAAHGFPIAATIVLSVAGGIVFFFAAYRAYRWVWRYQHQKHQILPKSSGDMSTYKRPASTSNLLRQEPKSNGFSQRFSVASINALVDEKEPDSPFSPDSSNPLNKPGHSNMSTDYLRLNGSRNSLALTTSGLSNMNKTSSRVSLVSTPGNRNSVYTLNSPTTPGVATVVQPHKRAQRLSGAPHSPFSRVDIVPPQPLGIVGNSVVATDKSTLNFSRQSGIMEDDGADRETLFDPDGYESQHGKGDRPTDFEAQKAIYLAQGPSRDHSRNRSIPEAGPFQDPESSDSSISHAPSGSVSLADVHQRAPSPVDSSPTQSTDEHTQISRPSTRLSGIAGQPLNAPTSPLDRLQDSLKHLTSESDAESQRSTTGSFRAPTSQLDQMLGHHSSQTN